MVLKDGTELILEVDDNVPVFDSADPRLRPLRAAPAQVVPAQDNTPQQASEESGSLGGNSQVAESSGAITPTQDKDKNKLSTIAPPSSHHLLHLEYHPGCPWCKVSKQRRRSARRVRGEKPKAKEWGEKISFDHFIVGDSPAAYGSKVALLVRDEGGSELQFYPAKSKCAAGVEDALRDFGGDKLDKIQLAYTDNAPEYKKTLHTLKIPHNTSIPNRPTSNSQQGRRWHQGFIGGVWYGTCVLAACWDVLVPKL